MSINQTLEIRKSTHGDDYKKSCEFCQAVKKLIRAANPNLSDLTQETLDRIVLKIGRIVFGDENHAEHWHDLCGYATLVENELPTKASELTDAELEALLRR